MLLSTAADVFVVFFRPEVASRRLSRSTYIGVSPSSLSDVFSACTGCGLWCVWHSCFFGCLFRVWVGVRAVAKPAFCAWSCSISYSIRRRAPKALAVLGGCGGMPPQKILKTGTPETPFPAIWAMIFSEKIAIDNDLIISLKNITGHQ